MAGAIVLVVILVVVMPVAVAMSGALAAGLLGTALRDNGEALHEGSELVEAQPLSSPWGRRAIRPSVQAAQRDWPKR